MFMNSDDDNSILPICNFSSFFSDRDQIMKHGVCVQVIGDLNLLPRDVQEVIAEAMFISRNNTR